MRVAVVAHRQSETNRSLAGARWGSSRAQLLRPSEATLALRGGDVALGRLDVVSTLDGVEPGLARLDRLDVPAPAAEARLQHERRLQPDRGAGLEHALGRGVRHAGAAQDDRGQQLVVSGEQRPRRIEDVDAPLGGLRSVTCS